MGYRVNGRDYPHHKRVGVAPPTNHLRERGRREGGRAGKRQSESGGECVG